MSPKIISPVVATILTAILIGIAYLYFFYPGNSKSGERELINKSAKYTHNPCLSDNEYADYSIDEKYAKEIKIPTVPVTIFVKDKLSNEVKSSFVIENLIPLVRMYKCGIYMVREFNKRVPDSRSELWKYNYSGKGTMVLTLALFRDKKPIGALYGTSLAIDPQEKYIVLERGYLGSQDYAAVIKELRTLMDVFVLTLEDVKKMNPAVEPGIIGLGKWSDDSKFVWGTIFNGPVDTAYLRVDIGSWKTDVFLPPPNLSGEQALNTDGYIAYTDFTTFYGIDSIAEEAFTEFRKEGRQKHLYLYNFFIKENKLIAAVSDPEWYFKPRWLSNSVLQYMLPPGATSTYTIQQ